MAEVVRSQVGKQDHYLLWQHSEPFPAEDELQVSSKGVQLTMRNLYFHVHAVVRYRRSVQTTRPAWLAEQLVFSEWNALDRSVVSRPLIAARPM